MKLDIACIAIKRFEKWYLIDIEDYLKEAKLEDNYYKAPIGRVLDKNLLNEDLIVFDTGNQMDYDKLGFKPPENSKEKGIYYKEIRVNEDTKEIRVKYGDHNSTEELIFEGYQKEVVEIIFHIIEKNLRNIYSNGFEFNDIEFIEDILPTRFSVADKLRDKFQRKDVEAIFNTLSKSVIFIGNNKETTYYLYRIASIIWHKYKELLETQNIDFKEIKDLLPKLYKFRRTFN